MDNAVRMLSESVVSVSATLTKDVLYNRWNGQEVMLFKGVQVLVDPEKGIACHSDDYFEIYGDEYSIDFMN